VCYLRSSCSCSFHCDVDTLVWTDLIKWILSLPVLTTPRYHARNNVTCTVPLCVYTRWLHSNCHVIFLSVFHSSNRNLRAHAARLRTNTFFLTERKPIEIHDDFLWAQFTLHRDVDCYN
jgi:hypothetical protein